MKSLRLVMMVLACAATPVCFAQWQWTDKDGRKVFSDQAPPSSIPEKDIARRPGARATTDSAPAAPDAQAVLPSASGELSAVKVAPAAASAPKVSGRDKELEEKKKQAQAAEAEKKKAQDEEIAKLRADNCDRAKRGKQLLDSGSRISTTNAKGEREIMDDAARMVEGKRLEGLIARDCRPA